LPYLVFRFSNVYGRFDNDIERMERVIPLFIRKISGDEPITIYGAEKVLDFTYIDDCVDGIVRGIEALVSGRVRNETINLAFGQGNTLVRVAEVIAGTVNKAPRITLAPPLLGEVTHYIANIGKAEQLLGYRPTTPLDKGIERAIAWTQDWAAAHPSTAPAPAPAKSQSEISEGRTAAGLGYKYSPQKMTPHPARERPVGAVDPEDGASH
jgi:UDP-glucose 4-epimerase